MDDSSSYPPQPGYEHLKQPQAQAYSTNTDKEMNYSSSYPSQPHQGYEYLQQPPQAQTHTQEGYRQQYSQDSTQSQTYDPSQPPNYHFYTYDPHQQYPYYPAPTTLTHQPISDPPSLPLFPANFPITQNPHRGRGGSGRSSRGRGRRGRSCHIPYPSAAMPPQPQSRSQPQPQPQSQPQPQPRSQPRSQPHPYYCEVCGVGCNSREILEMHNNGKKHKKKLQELGGANHKSDPQVPENETKNNAEGEADVAVVVDNPNRDDEGNKRKSMISKASERGVKNRRLGGEGGAALKALVAPIVCELCDVKCDTQAVFDIHLSGKKHRSKVRQSSQQSTTVDDPHIALARFLKTYATSNVQLDPAQLKCLVDLCNGAVNNVAAAPVESVEQVPDQPQEEKIQ